MDVKINLILLFLMSVCFFIFTRVVINYGTYKEMLRMYREDRIFFEKAQQYGLISNKENEENDNEDTPLNPKEESEWSISDWERHQAYYFWLIILIPLLAILFYILMPLWSQGE